MRVLRYKTKLVNKKAVLVKESSRNYPDMPRNQFRRSSDVASFGKAICTCMMKPKNIFTCYV